ncbi:high-temperature-induced dauer-formation protein-domain-containing protein [Leucosporidium creatinivorum]|uniref:High-temperature-induced dauer-formation protein-domain-containing protein n=1 Tax=Leucosporidium creatinivorum TaxID=106004 RepID=A0A1Y2FXA6_9BASI|nr:high-temperature-induced dauer-formation protein-domain-containing protein [Leucosporidium creatinivorum]
MVRMSGQDPKLEFRKPGQGVSLLSGPAIPATDPYWTPFYTLFDSPTEVHTLLDSSTLLLTVQQSPVNLATLITVLCDHLFDLLSIPSFPHPPPTPRGAEQRDLAKEALNCLRVLSRVVPFVLGPQSTEPGELEEAIFWRSEKIRVERPVSEERTRNSTEAPREAEEGQFVIDDEEEDEEDEENEATATPKPAAESSQPTEEWEEIPPLAERLLAALVDLAFVPGFTVAEECRTQDGAVVYVIWEPGIAHSPSSPLPPTPSSLLSARLEVLRLLAILLSLPSLLTPPHAFPSLPNRWREVLVGPVPGIAGAGAAAGGRLERKVVLCLLCSLLNTALGKPSCLQVLSALLVEHAPAPESSVDPSSTSTTAPTPGPSPFVEQSATMGSSSSAPSPPSNAFAFYLAKLHRSSDFDFLLSGFLALLDRGLGGSAAAPLANLGLGVGGTTGAATGTVETLVVLWRVVEGNAKFASWLAEQERVGEVLAWLVVAGLEGKDDETQLGLVRLAAFLLQSLTADQSPAFAARLNAPVELKPSLRSKYGVPGSLADFIIISLCTLIFTTSGRLSALYPAYVLTIDNISPLIKHLSAVASTRLTKLFLAFAAPGFLLMEEGNPRLIYYLLETFNNVIHFQLSDNPELVYALIRSHARFDQLSTFTLAGGVAEVRRARQEKKAAAAAAASGSNPLSTITEGRTASTPPPKEGEGEEGGEEGEDGEKEVSEKARGKMRARRTDSVSSLSVADLSLGGNGAQSSAEEGQPFVGKNGFVPTEGWVASWRGGLPLDSIHIMLAELRPLVLDLPSSTTTPLSSSTSSASAPTSAISLLSSASLSGLLPPAPPPHPRKFLASPQSVTWLASLIYGNIYLSNLELLREVEVRLFGVAQGGGGRRGLGGLMGGMQGGNPLEFVSGAARELLGRVGR